MMRIDRKREIAALVLTLMIALAADAGNWPMWRSDSARTSISDTSLPANKPSLLWEHQFSPRTQVWDSPLNNYLMQYDKTFEPIVFGQTLMVGFNDRDKLVGMDTRSGKISWTYYCGGPIRLAPVASNNRVYFGSDDGFFYCLEVETGKEVWKFQAAPTSKKLIGNRRIISMWPVRGGAVIEDDVVYFSAGIWPFMGVFIYALDAQTGDVIWVNDHDSIKYRTQPHRPSMAFAGVAPQGAFAINKDKLIVPGGRSIPAILDRKTGEIVRYDFDKYDKYVGGDFVASAGEVYYTRGRERKKAPGSTLFEIDNGKKVLKGIIAGLPVPDKGVTYFSGEQVAAYQTDETGKLQTNSPIWSVDADATGDLIKAGNHLYAAGKGVVTAIKIISDTQAEIAWELKIKGDIVRLIVADERLFAVTSDGRILALGQGRKRSISHKKNVLKSSIQADGLADNLLAQTQSRSGWGLVNGIDNLKLVIALLAKTDHNFVVLDSSPDKVERARVVLDSAGVYGSRVTVHCGSPSTFDLAPYAIELAITSSQESLGELDAAQLLNNLRPYGGMLVILGGDKALPSTISSDDYSIVNNETGVFITREGALKGSASWTHQYGSIAQTAKSDDKRVKLPLGILWWGGSSNMDVLPRHAHGPSEQVIGGRLFIQGINSFSARDVYTGRVLWKRELPELNKMGVYFTKSYDEDPLVVGYNQVHVPGANLRGANFVATDDKLYLIKDEKCLVLDTVTGKTLSTFYLPGKAAWGYIGVKNDMLIGGAGFSDFTTGLPEESQQEKKNKKRKKKRNYAVFNKSASQALVIMNRHSGKVIWSTTAQHGYLHNGIAVGNDTLFALDRVPLTIFEQLIRRGDKGLSGRLHAFNLKNGKPQWDRSEGVFGSYVSFSETHNILLHSTRPSRDMVPGETGRRMAALNGTDGTVIWEQDINYKTFPILHTDTIICESGKWDLLTGNPVSRSNPITGGKELWSWERTYGCNYPVASEHLLTFRSGAAGFYDLEGDGGTGTFGGFKSGCSINLIAADGVLSAPDYTRTCNCAYQNQTSLAMINMPDMEFWTTSTLAKPADKEIQRIGLNFGAPGDRKSGQTYWVDYPSIGGKSPDPTIRIEGPVKWHLGNAARFGDAEKNWVYASCAENINSVTVQLAAVKPVGNAKTSETGGELISKSAEWAYLAGKKPADNWVERSFDDLAWTRGKAGFGYGDDDDATKLKDMRGKYTSVCIRKTFTVSDPSKILTLSLKVGYDDYFTAYINGKKVVSTQGGHERKRGTWDAFEIPVSKLLLKGKNVIAIEGNNISSKSSDFSLDPYLVAKISASLETVSERVVAKQSKEVGDIGTYTVRLYFAEPLEIKPKDRVFDLSLNGTTVIENLDVLSEAGAPRKGIVKEFKHIRCVDGLILTTDVKTKKYGAIISGIELIKE